MSRIYEAMERARLLGEDGRPRMQPANQLRKLAPENSQDPFDRLMQSISWALAPQSQETILVTSSIHGEGSSTVARNLAEKLAKSQFTTLLIDANLRRPTQHLALRSSRSVGVADLATGNLPVEKVLGTSPETGLTFLPSGRPTKSPIQVLESPRFTRALDKLRDRFERIVIDGPPVTAYPDSATIGRLVDGAVIVVRAESTHREDVEKTQKVLERAGARVLGAVLNRRRYHIPSWIYERL
jgi:capsular exopolysaccharide synthesis family protein